MALSGIRVVRDTTNWRLSLLPPNPHLQFTMAIAITSLLPAQSPTRPLSFPRCISLSSPALSHRLLPQSKNASPSTISASSRPSLPPNPPKASSTALDLDNRQTLQKPSPSLPFRIGHGFDLHRLEPGYPLIIGGIDIPHDRGCEAHSDGNLGSSPLFLIWGFGFCNLGFSAFFFIWGFWYLLGV